MKDKLEKRIGMYRMRDLSKLHDVGDERGGGRGAVDAQLAQRQRGGRGAARQRGAGGAHALPTERRALRARQRAQPRRVRAWRSGRPVRNTASLYTVLNSGTNIYCVTCNLTITYVRK